MLMTDKHGNVYTDATMKRLKYRPIYNVIYNSSACQWEVVRCGTKSCKVLHRGTADSSRSSNLTFLQNVTQQYNEQAIEYFKEK